MNRSSSGVEVEELDSVDIIMGTYNGAGYVVEQIESIKKQTHRRWTLYVRDDGSKDETLQVLSAVARGDSRIVLVTDELGNLGFGENFRLLLKKSSAAYVMYCDQDDYWLPAKIEKTLAAIKIMERANPGIAALVHCDARLVDAQLNALKPTFVGRRGTAKGLPALLFANSVQGAASMINAALRQKALELEPTLPYDYHNALIAEVVGARVFIEEPLLLYRQHSANVIGATKKESDVSGARVAPQMHVRLQMAFDASPHVLRVLNHFMLEARKSVVIQRDKYLYVLNGKSRIKRALTVLLENYQFYGRLDKFRLMAAIFKGRV